MGGGATGSPADWAPARCGALTASTAIDPAMAIRRTPRGVLRIAIAGSMAVLAVSAPHRAGAQSAGDPVAPPPIKSMGQPPLWQPYTSLVTAFGRDNDATGGLELGLY